MFGKHFSTVRFFKSEGKGKSSFIYSHDVDCSNLSEFGIHKEIGLLAIYGTDVDQIVPQMDRKERYLVVLCPADKRVSDKVEKLGNAVWVDPESVDEEEWYAFGPKTLDHSLFKKVGQGEAVAVEFSKPKPKPKSKPKSSKKKRAHNKDGTFKADDPSTPENEAFEDDKK